MLFNSKKATAARPAAPVNNGGVTVTKTNPLIKAPVRNPNTTRIASTLGNIGAGGDTIIFTLNNSAGSSAKKYIIGDSYGIVEAEYGASLADPDSVDSGTVAGFKALWANRPVQVTAMSLSTSSSASQFSEKIEYCESTNTGGLNKRPIRIKQFESPSDQNRLIRPVELQDYPGGIVLGDLSAVVFSVMAAETLTVTLILGNQVV